MRVAATFIAAGLLATSAAPAAGSPAGAPGFCTDDHGTTVVVDFTALGGDVVVRCAPGSAERTGADALEDAGFDVDGTTRFGESAVCRIAGRPAANEELAVENNDGYREACIGMPPSAAYWSYWSADNGGAWSYSQYGAQNREAIDGGFEGWSFALNSTSAEPPAPGIDPVRPTSTADEPDSAGDDGVGDDAGGVDRTNGSDGRAGSDDGDTGGPSDKSEGTGNLPKPLKRDTSPAPTAGTQNGVDWSGGEKTPSPDVAAQSSSEAGPGVMPWVAAGVIGVLAVLIGVTTVRRRSHRGTASP